MYLAPVRYKYYMENDMRKLFEKTEAINIIFYLKEKGLYQKAN